jgi:inner membrane protein
MKWALFVAVDSITQAVLGAAVGEVMLGRRMGNRAMGWGALFGTLPDLDVLVSPFLNHSWNLWWHRGPSHSLLLMVLVSWWLGKPLARLWKKDKISPRLAGWFVFMAWSTHVLIDCFTVYGTSVFWPFSSHRVGFNHMFIIDPLFTLPMVVGLVWAAFLKTKKQLPKRRRIHARALVVSCIYALLSVGMKQVASDRFDADLMRRGVEWERRMEAPTPFNILLWRSVVDRGDEFWVGYRTVFEPKTKPVRWTVYPKEAKVLDRVHTLPEARRVDWFADGWWIARSHAKGVWLGDLRFGEGRRWGARPGIVDARLVFAWDILPEERASKLRPKRMERSQAGEMLRRMAWRVVGDEKGWEANPRLDGVTGSLPETLRVID